MDELVKASTADKNALVELEEQVNIAREQFEELESAIIGLEGLLKNVKAENA